MSGKFDFNAMLNSATEADNERLAKLEEEVRRLGGQIVGTVQASIDSVKLDDRDPIPIQIAKTQRVIELLRPVAEAVRQISQGSNRNQGGSGGSRSRTGNNTGSGNDNAGTGSDTGSGNDNAGTGKKAPPQKRRGLFGQLITQDAE